MFIVYNQGLDAFLTTKGWQTFTILTNKNKSYNLVVGDNNTDIDKINKYIQANAITTTKGVVLVELHSLSTDFPKKTMDFNLADRSILLSGVQVLVSTFISYKAGKAKSTTILKPEIISGQNNIIISADSLTETQTKTTKKQKKKAQNIDDLARIKRELRYDSDFMDETMLLTKNINQIYKKAKEVSLYYPTILSEIDGQIQDELHYVEFHKLNMFKAHKLAKKLHKLRVKRRIIKDKINTANWILAELDEDKVNSLNQIAFKLEQLDERRYLIRDPKSFKRKVQKTAEIE